MLPETLFSLKSEVADNDILLLLLLLLLLLVLLLLLLLLLLLIIIIIIIIIMKGQIKETRGKETDIFDIRSIRKSTIKQLQDILNHTL